MKFLCVRPTEEVRPQPGGRELQKRDLLAALRWLARRASLRHRQRSCAWRAAEEMSIG